MKVKFSFKHLILPLAVLFACALILTAAPPRAGAEESVQSALSLDAIELPSSYLEYRELHAPRDVYYDEEVTAIIEDTETENTPEASENDKTLVVYYGGIFSSEQLQNASQIDRLGGYLVYQQDSAFYAYSLADRTSAQIKDSESNVITGSYFCLNYEYFLVFSTSLIKIYSVDAANFTFTDTGLRITANANSNPIAINDSHDLFYFNNSTLYRKNLKSAESGVPYSGSYATTTDSRLLVDEKYLYISSSTGVSRLDIHGNGDSETILPAATYEETIADLISPVGLAFRNGNLLVADTASDKIVEFSLTDFEYTGFAITDTANAENRLTAVTPDIAVNGNALAVITDSKVLLKKDGVCKKYDIGRVNSGTSSLALGDKYIAVVIGTQPILIFIDTETGEAIEFTDYDSGMMPVSVAYSRGIFHLATQSLVYGTRIYPIDEATLTAGKAPLVIEALIPNFTVDIDGNIYTCQNTTVSKYENKVLSATQYVFSSEPKKIGVDLNGNVYALLDDNRLEYYKNGERKSVDLTFSENLPEKAKATSMAMSFDNKKVYFLFNDYGFVLSASGAENDSITNVSVPAGFCLTDANAPDPSGFSLIAPQAGKNLYRIGFSAESDTFGYLGLAASAGGYEYVLGGETDNFYILVSEELFLVKKSDIAETDMNDSAFSASDPENAYVSTDVYLYYHPVLTADGRYALGGSQRLAAKTQIVLHGSLAVNSKEFYLAEYNGIKGYVPADFVTDELAQTPETDDYSVKIIDASGKKEVTVYADAALSEPSEVLAEKTEVKAYATENPDVFYVTYTRADGSEGFGYVTADSFLIRGRHAVRNVIIIVLVALSVAVTSLYFINRNKNKKTK